MSPALPLSNLRAQRFAAAASFMGLPKDKGDAASSDVSNLIRSANRFAFVGGLRSGKPLLLISNGSLNALYRPGKNPQLSGNRSPVPIDMNGGRMSLGF